MSTILLFDIILLEFSFSFSVSSIVLTQNNHTRKPESFVRQARTVLDSNQDVPVNLTCKLKRNQQTVKFENVSAGFSNNSHASYRQGSADTESGNRLDKINVH